MSSAKKIPDEHRELLLAEYGLSSVSRADDDHFDNSDEEEYLTENEIVELNAVQLTRASSKRYIMPFVIGGVAVVLLLGIILGLSLSKKPGTSLEGYSMATDSVMPSWWTTVTKNSTYTMSKISGGIFFSLPDHKSIWLFGRSFLTILDKVTVPLSSSALLVDTLQSSPLLGRPTWVYDSTKYVPTYILPVHTPTDICQPSTSTAVDGKIFLFWKYFHPNQNDSYGWGTGLLNTNSLEITRTQNDVMDRLWDPEATIIVGNEIYVYFLHDSLYEDGQDELYVGRMPLSSTSFYNVRKYMTYWDGRTFTSRADKAAPLIDRFGKQASVIYNSSLKKFLLLDSGYENTLRIYASSSPYQGWNEAPKVLYNEPQGPITQAYWMPSLFENNGNIMYLSYKIKNEEENLPTILKVRILKR